MAQKTLCQSCGMPMKTASDFGSEKNGEKSSDYCHYCYANGDFTTPDLTFREMMDVGLKALDEEVKMNIFLKKLIQKLYPFQLKRLKRWK